MLDNFKDKFKTNINYYIFGICFFVYVLILIEAIVFKFGNHYLLLGSEPSSELHFGSFIKVYMQMDLNQRFINSFNYGFSKIESLLEDLFVNIFAFMPLGTLLTMVIKKHKIILSSCIGFIISLIVELFQLFTAFGVASIVDIITNTIGSLIGSLLYLFISKFIKADRTNFVINLSTTICIILFLPLAIYGIVSIVQNIDVIAYRWYYIN